MSASAALMGMATVSSIRRSLVKSRSACATPEAACVARVVKEVLALKVKVDSVVRRDHRKVAILLLPAPKAVAHPAGLKAVVLASVDLVARMVVVRDLVVACLATRKSPSSAWTRMPMAASLKKNMSPR